MIGTLAWKEYREHQTVWAAMTALAVLLLVTLTQVWAPHGVAAAPAEKLQLDCPRGPDADRDLRLDLRRHDGGRRSRKPERKRFSIRSRRTACDCG